MSQVDQLILGSLNREIKNYLTYNQAAVDAEQSIPAIQRVGMVPRWNPYGDVLTVIETGPIVISPPPKWSTSYSDEMKAYYYG